MGPLTGYKILEFGGIGPVPMCGMVLSDMGAEIIRLERPDIANEPLHHWANFPLRGRKSVVLDLKKPAGVHVALKLARQADAVLEGYRPGVMEKLGLGPEALFDVNPKLVYGRMTGWGQSGPLAQRAGHDINYIALTGALDSFGRAGDLPTPPANLVGDFGGGALYLATGVLAALLDARTSGQGQVVDAAMTDGSASLMASIYGFHAAGFWTTKRGTNLLDTGAPFYDVYECACGGCVAVGAIEPQFYAALLDHLGLVGEELPAQMDTDNWPRLKDIFTRKFKTRTRDEWSAIFEPVDACVTPVLSIAEAPHHPHNLARRTFHDVDGRVQPGVAPRFSRSAPATPETPRPYGADSVSALKDWGISTTDIEALLENNGLGNGP